MLKPSQAAQTLAIPVSTLRRWAVSFEGFLSPRTGSHRSYTTDDIAVLSRIKDSYTTGLTTEQIRQALPVMQGEKVNSLMTLTDFASALEMAHFSMAKMQAQLDDQAAQLAALQQQITELTEKPKQRSLLARLFGA